MLLIVACRALFCYADYAARYSSQVSTQEESQEENQEENPPLQSADELIDSPLLRNLQQALDGDYDRPLLESALRALNPRISFLPSVGANGRRQRDWPWIGARNVTRVADWCQQKLARRPGTGTPAERAYCALIAPLLTHESAPYCASSTSAAPTIAATIAATITPATTAAFAGLLSSADLTKLATTTFGVAAQFAPRSTH